MPAIQATSHFLALLIEKGILRQEEEGGRSTDDELADIKQRWPHPLPGDRQFSE